MLSQWQCIQQNIGTWHGAFIQFSPKGELVKETPSVLTLEETEPGKTMELTLVRFPEAEPEKTNKLTFTAPGPAPYVYFFENGSFAQGSAQWSSFGQFGTEFSLKVAADRRVRYVIMYEGTPSYTSRIKYVTLICETADQNDQFAEPDLAPQQQFGKWQGNVEVLNASGELEPKGTSQWTLDENLALSCQEDFSEQKQNLIVEKDTEPTLQDNVVALKETNNGLDYQLMTLPNGAYCLLPQEIKKERAFRIEVGWKSLEGERFSDGDVSRTRFIRYYDTRGVWTHSALVQDSLKT